MRWPDLFPAGKGLESATFVLLCFAMLSFPFSVAATNSFLALTLAGGVFSGAWWVGCKALWKHYRILLVLLILYLALVVVGLLWSIDPEWGRHILARHWFWLLLPVIVLTLSSEKHRSIFFLFMSVGLSANLFFCVLQASGVIESPAVAGSTVENATGHIGHTSFGFIYGVWAAWLFHLGFSYQNKFRWLLWAMCSWALVMVFLSAGKSGYLIALIVMMIVALKWWQEAGNKRMLLLFLTLILLLGTFMVFGPVKDRLIGSWQALTHTAPAEMSATQLNAVSSVAARLEWWKMSYEIWLDQPILGVGTGGFPKAASMWQKVQLDRQEYAVSVVHPHNQYLLAMVRWGVVGLLLLLALLFCWIRLGFSREWRHSVATPLLTLTGAALLVHGLSSASMEEHFSTIFAMALAASALSELREFR